MNRAGDRSRFAAAFLAAGFLASFTVPATADDDAQLLQKLRPEQRQYVFVASRDGIPRLLAYEPVRILAARPRQHAHGRSKPPERIAANARRTAPAIVAAVRPAPKPGAVPVTIAYVARPARAAPGLLVSAGRSFVPTRAGRKPSDRPTPAPVLRDLAWLHAHRFDVPKPDELQIPGIPVRSQVASPFDIASGAFHGVRTVNGYSAVRVRVSIPCGAAHFSTGYGYNEVTKRNGIVDQETGFIYIGGWGAGPRGVPVDAGLQKASAQAEHDDYAFYFKYANNHPITYPIRFPCGGPDPVLELYPVSNTLLVFSITGMTDQGRHMTLTIVQRTRPEDGWNPGGGSSSDGIILKRIVAIAQPPDWHRFFGIFHRDRFKDGSYFGVNGPSDQTPRIKWQSCQIGRVAPPAIAPSYRPWDAADTWHPASNGVYSDWPPADVFRSTEGVCDAVGISLRNV